MEIIENRRMLATKIAYISNIMVYYGYIHECAELYRELSKDSREEWDKNVKAIVNVIMKHKNSRCNLEFKGDFTIRVVKFLTVNQAYNYFKIGVNLKGQSYYYITEFIRNLDQYSDDLFWKVSILYHKSDHSKIQEFLEVYFSKRLDKTAIQFDVK